MAMNQHALLIDWIKLGGEKSPSQKWAKEILLVVGGSLFVALLAQAEMRLPLSPVPITLQSLGVLLVGAVLGSKRGALALMAYLAEGSAGLPFFAGGGFGITHLMGPTGGYLIGFILAAWLMGFLAERGFDRKLFSSLIMISIGHAIIFIPGLFWLGKYVGANQALVAGFFPFIPGLIIKTAAVASLLPILRKRKPNS